MLREARAKGKCVAEYRWGRRPEGPCRRARRRRATAITACPTARRSTRCGPSARCRATTAASGWAMWAAPTAPSSASPRRSRARASTSTRCCSTKARGRRFTSDDLGEAGALACGRLADGTPLYLSLGNTGDAVAKVPLEAQARNDWGYPHPVLMAATGAETPPAAAEPAGSAGRDRLSLGAGLRRRDPRGRASATATARGGATPRTVRSPRRCGSSARSFPTGPCSSAGSLAEVRRASGPRRATTEVDEYEVLLDAGEWR